MAKIYVELLYFIWKKSSNIITELVSDRYDMIIVYLDYVHEDGLLT